MPPEAGRNAEVSLRACTAISCEIRKRCLTLQCLFIHVDSAGNSVCQARHDGYLAPNHPCSEQSQYLQAACLHIKQAERQICANWLVLDYESIPSTSRMSLIESYDPARPKYLRNLTPDALPHLADYYQRGCLHAFQALSWADLTAIGAVLNKRALWICTKESKGSTLPNWRRNDGNQAGACSNI